MYKEIYKFNPSSSRIFKIYFRNPNSINEWTFKSLPLSEEISWEDVPFFFLWARTYRAFRRGVKGKRKLSQ